MARASCLASGRSGQPAREAFGESISGKEQDMLVGYHNTYILSVWY